jgi:hypothetical protein
MPNEVVALLTQNLAALLLPLLWGIRAFRKKFALDPARPTIHEGIIVGIMFALGFGLAFAGSRIAVDAPIVMPQTLVDLWPVQGFLFGLGLMLSDMAMDQTSIKTASAEAKIEAINAGGE